ncbi:sulfatase-like hydrolase/transferase [Erwinia sorbitola]|uniref:Sulfatase-like hydrolase/transferase n=1 Tax=Erwinia sorbitola TaxID=2681984 RepID=A0ABW9RFE2_9GAMM|nr:sulfatase-like hydrolase/transferase [Erwinia sorbitola]MTD28259.1 sulfatase-like hydrolase/transferase [Erwinia sorbitola]
MSKSISKNSSHSLTTLSKPKGVQASSRSSPEVSDAPAAPSIAAVTPPPRSPQQLPEGYNILLVTSDQEHYFEKYPFPVPGRERLRQTGTTFTNHYINSCVCTSSRSVMYTGLHMPQTRMYDNIGMPWMPWSLDPKLGTIATLIKQLGYYSAYKGKWHLSTLLDKSLDTVASHDIDDLDHAPLHKSMEEYGFEDYSGIGDLIGLHKGGYEYDSLTTAQAISWLRTKGRSMADTRQPWLLAVNLVNPHDVMFIDTDAPGEKVQWHAALNDSQAMTPVRPPENMLYAARWDEVPLAPSRHQPFDEPGRPDGQWYYQQANAVMVGQFPDEDRRWKTLQDYYFNCIRDHDTHLVSLLDELEALNLTENTIIVFTSDHGELQGYHKMHGKGTCVYSPQVHVPMIICHPDYVGGQTCKALTSHLDLAPTLLGLTGRPQSKIAPIMQGRKGKDFSKLIQNPGQATLHQIRDASLYCYDMILYIDADYLRKMNSVRNSTSLSEDEKQKAMKALSPDFRRRTGIRMLFDGRYKFARYFSLRQHNMPETWEELLEVNDLELYDLENDPQEMNNLALDPESSRSLIMTLNKKLNALYHQEIGIDDGSFLPKESSGWSLSTGQFAKLVRD